MTRIMSLVLLAALATTPTLAQTSRGGTAAAGGGLSAADDGGHNFHGALQPRNAPLRIAASPEDGNPYAASAAQWHRWAEEICGGDALIWWTEEEENGDPADGQVEMECLDDD